MKDIQLSRCCSDVAGRARVDLTLTASTLVPRHDKDGGTHYKLFKGLHSDM